MPDRLGHELDGLHVLVVDDNDDARHLIASVLDYHGANVHAVAGAVEALTLLQTMRVDVMVSDLSMPGLTGYDLLQKLREQPHQRPRPTPAIALTAFAGQRDEALRAGFAGYIVKPFETETLVREIQRLATPAGRG
jgi:CheY-like chemotaxis protein